MEMEKHYVMRSGWLRAAILGANDGILSTASIVIGVAAASETRDPIVLAGVAGLVAGALSMAAGEYVSIIGDVDFMVYLQYVFTIVFLALLGSVAARTGGSNIGKAVLRITFWGTIAMGVTGLIGYLFGVNLA